MTEPHFAPEPAPQASTSTSDPISAPNPNPKPPHTSRKIAPTARGRTTDSDDVRHSKTLSYILRHGAAKEHLVLRGDGFVRVDELLKRPKLKGVTFETIQRIVAENEKQRFTLQKEAKKPSGGDVAEDAEFEWWIRANQGHSVQVESLELKPILDASHVPTMVHGTTYKLWPTIGAVREKARNTASLLNLDRPISSAHVSAKQGLSKMARNHIHCATGLFGDTGVKSGMRAKCDLFIYLDVPKLLADNIPIYESSNNVLLTSGKDGIVSPTYFKKVERKIVGAEAAVEQLDLNGLSLQ
ncbi:BZ3500_MvSof-1268-A1-R1_Chr3-1g06000 [Microbotryum saponariae]|uniref:2'-phosphotransferase n=1 Tax=Microbotryum saponariae TaxID=289078 RepID=A0A2X0LK77_9BASI|nr:BZ3500_MvSof-1268-A1-R1_Chr3-1g06000 [Microbotryum saponariae]SDA05190.1 BZ3501_MvSof-1269-A2-R1_Chr3-1g05670 [Microbotryum saponariae]